MAKLVGWVLVVEDDQAIGELMCESLRARGLFVDWAADDDAAYKRIVSIPTLAALVLDVNLGQGASGYDIARFARRIIPDIGVIYVSGAVNPASFKAFGVPESAFIEKPFTGEQLVEVLLSACAQ